ncbi:MAG: glycerophosphodiester phosphodiesterase [Myxococcota bacterium]
MTPRLLGHRGACAEFPENTMPSFRRAVEVGVDVLETDVHRTRDGVIVVSHDPDGQRSAGVGRLIAQCTLAEVRGWDVGWGYVDASGSRPFAGQGIGMPTLEDALDAFPDQRFNVDIKTEQKGLVPDLLALLEARGDSDRVTLASFFDAVIDEVRNRGFRGTTALSRKEVFALATLPTFACRKLIKGHFAQIPVAAGPLKLATRAFIKKCHRLGLLVDYWTINDVSDAHVLLERGADGIITDDPAALRPAVARYRG